MKTILSFVLAAFVLSGTGFSQTTSLPPPQKTGGMPLMEALSKRQTSREFSDKKLPDQVVSNLLWASWGFNRPEQKKRTAPSSQNKQEIEVYVVMQEGVFLYDAGQNALVKAISGDIRAKAGKQDFVATAPLTLVFVADFTKMAGTDDQQKEVTANTDAAFISQNAYLYCASENLATGVRAYIDKDELHKAMNLKPEQHITLAQSVGYFKK
jgi:hypothetical protein